MKEKDTLTSAFVRLRYRLHRIASGILGDSDDADDALQREHILDDVQRIIAQNLSPQQRRVLDLREVQGLSFEAIAEMLSMQPAAVRMTLSRARKTIREIYLNTSDNE